MKNYVLLFLCLFFFMNTNNINAQENPENGSIIKKKLSSKEQLFKNGFWLDFGAGTAIFHEKNSIFHNQANDPHFDVANPSLWKARFALHVNFGHKWYLHGNDRHKFGLQTTFIGGGINLFRGMYIDLGALGFCSSFRLNEKSALDINLNAGPSLYRTDVAYIGGQVNVELKYRVGYFTIGTIFRYSKKNYDPYNTAPSVYNFMLTLGAKF